MDLGAVGRSDVKHTGLQSRGCRSIAQRARRALRCDNSTMMAKVTRSGRATGRGTVTGSTDAAATRALDDAAHQRFVGRRDLTAWPSTVGRLAVALTRRLRTRVAPHEALLFTLAIGLALVSALTAAAGAVYDAVAESDGVTGLDRPALKAAEDARSPVANTIVTAYTNLGGPVAMPVLAAVAAVALALLWRRWTPVVLMAATATGSLTLTIVGKAVVGRARPPLAEAVPPYEHSASFPSGHSLNAVALAGMVAYLLLREQRSRYARAATVGLAAGFALTMGLSRVYLGHHWLTDVLVAWALGLAWLTAVILAHRLFLTTRHQPDHQVPASEPPPQA